MGEPSVIVENGYGILLTYRRIPYERTEILILCYRYKKDFNLLCAKTKSRPDNHIFDVVILPKKEAENLVISKIRERIAKRPAGLVCATVVPAKMILSDTIHARI